MSTLFHNIAKFSCPDGFKLLPRKIVKKYEMKEYEIFIRSKAVAWKCSEKRP